MNVKHFILIIMMVFFAILCMQVALIVFCGLLPFVLSLMTDEASDQSMTFCVGICSLSSVVPNLIHLAQKNFSYDYAMTLIVNPKYWLVSLSTAGLGCFMALVCRPIISQIIIANAKRRVENYKAQKTYLTTIWKDLDEEE
jgi:hypothetical protein